MNSSLLKAVKTSLFLVLLTPLIMGPFGLTLSAFPKAVFFRSLIEIVLIIYLFLVFFDRKYLPRVSLLTWALLIFTGVMILSALAGFNPYRSFFGDLERGEGVILHLHLLTFFLMVSGVFVKKKDWFRVFKISAGVSGISSFAALLQKLGVWHFYGVSIPSRVSGTLSNPDFFAPYIVLSLFITLFVFFIEKEKDMKFVWGGIIFLHSFTLILSKTRGAWVALGLALLFCFFIWFFKYSNVHRKKIALLVLLLSLILLFLVLNKENVENGLLNRALSVFEFSFGSRGDVWEISFEAFKEKPLLGWGPESFSYIFYKYFKADYFSEIPEGMYFDYAHNKIFNLLASTGILGLLSWLGVLGVSFYLLFKKIVLEKKLVLLLSVFLVAYFFQSLTVFDTISIYLLLFLVLAFINVLSSRPLEIKRVWLFLPLIVLPLLSLYFINLGPLLAASSFPANVGYEKTNPVRAVSEYSEASKSIYKNDLKFVTIERGLLLLEKGNKKEGIAKIIYKDKDYLKELLEKPDRRPVDTLEYLARTYQWNYLFFGDEEDLARMEETIEKGIDFNDQRPEFYRLKAELRLMEGNEEKAKDLFLKEAGLFPTSEVKYYRNLGSGFLKIGKKKEASLYLKKTVEAMENPNLKDAQFMEKVAILFCRDLEDIENCKDIYYRLMEFFPEKKNYFENHLNFFLKE